MRIPEQTLKEAEKLSHPAVAELLKFYHFVTGNSVYEAYVIRRIYEEKWNKELTTNTVQLINSPLKKTSETELLAHDKAVDRVRAFFNDQLKFQRDTEAMREMLTPEQKDRALVDSRLKKEIVDIAL